MTAHTVLFYASSPEASARFYADLLGLEPAFVSPPFALFKLASGTELGLWDPKVVQPAPDGGAGGGELGFKVESPGEVDTTHDAWMARGATIALPPQPRLRSQLRCGGPGRSPASRLCDDRRGLSGSTPVTGQKERRGIAPAP